LGLPDAVQSARSAPVVLEERSGAVLTLRMNRPERLNALNVELGRALAAALKNAGDDDSVRAVVLTGAGRGFCAGGDLALLRDARNRNAAQELEGLLYAGKDIVLAIAGMRKPVVASVNGPAAGGGMNLALACDIRIASEQASFCEAFTKLGLCPDFGGMYTLPRLVGPAKAAELFFTAETLSAPEALRLGIVNRVVPAERLEEETRLLAERLAAAPPLAVEALKQTLTGSELERVLDEEVRQQVRCFVSEDCAEGLNAFFEKRRPQFRGH
jgi:2-(1,2-epoxy-1,2-dihydrophenyl)acetyl-CoA isomerase